MELNKEYEVTEAKYNVFKTVFKGLVAHRKEEGKYYVKALLFLGHKKVMTEIIKYK